MARKFLNGTFPGLPRARPAPGSSGDRASPAGGFEVGNGNRQTAHYRANGCPHDAITGLPSRVCVLVVGKVFMAVVKQVNRARKTSAVSDPQGVRVDPTSGRSSQTPTELHLSSRSSLTDITPGDIVFLDEFSYVRESFAPNFVAVLGCPLCGSPSLITSAQYSRGAPIICTSKLCSGLFRIIDEALIVSLPPS